MHLHDFTQDLNLNYLGVTYVVLTFISGQRSLKTEHIIFMEKLLHKTGVNLDNTRLRIGKVVQLVEGTPSKVVALVRFLVGSYRRLEKKVLAACRASWSSLTRSKGIGTTDTYDYAFYTS